MIRLRPRNGEESYYYNHSVNKDRIVLHFTAGYLKGDVAALTRSNNHVSVPFLIARDGTIYNLFQSGRWSYHLGRGAIGGNKNTSRRSVGVELSNIGPLVKQEGKLYSTYTDPNGRYFDHYCNENEEEFYVELDSPYRNHLYFATFTEAQYTNLILLLRYLTARYGIPPSLLGEGQRYEATPEIASTSGIVSHVNFRRNGKWDIGPAFDWDRIASIG